VETAARGLAELGVQAGETLLINGGAGAVGTVATQLAVAQGLAVIVTASERNADRLRSYGAQVTAYGDGLAERVGEWAPDGVDRVFDMGPGGALPELVKLVGDPQRVLTISDFAGAGAAGVKVTGGADSVRRWDALDHAATLIEQGKLTLPVQQTFELAQVADAERLSQEGHLSGKLVLLVD
jgi:NADPH:quinone reductase-like Zn-dependent oxidoreductase